MVVTVDRAGRVVIPKEVRERLALTPDVELDVIVEGDSVRLQPVRRPGRRIVEIDGWPVIERGGLDPVTDADVQRLRDADQR
ncbi:MAG: AbrB/MazE/SpoVT family DNA-binding domain-containing protein [Actinomycetota bacterium]